MGAGRAADSRGAGRGRARAGCRVRAGAGSFAARGRAAGFRLGGGASGSGAALPRTTSGRAAAGRGSGDALCKSSRVPAVAQPRRSAAKNTVTAASAARRAKGTLARWARRARDGPTPDSYPTQSGRTASRVGGIAFATMPAPGIRETSRDANRRRPPGSSRRSCGHAGARGRASKRRRLGRPALRGGRTPLRRARVLRPGGRADRRRRHLLVARVRRRCGPAPDHRRAARTLGQRGGGRAAATGAQARRASPSVRRSGALMRVATSGGGGGTIVVDIAGVRAAAATLADAANAYHLLASRVRGHALPEMPPGVSGSVAASIQEAASTIASGAPRLLALAQELRVRAFWAAAADRLMAGADLEGPLLDEFKAGMASGLLTKYSEPWQAELARSYAKELYDRAHPGGIAGFFHDVGGGIGDFFSGAWSAVKDPAVMLYHLTPLHSGWTDEWSQLGHGLSYGVTHPGEFGKALIGLDMLEDEGFAYWLGNLAPAVAATVMSGGAGAAVRGADGVAAVDRAAVGIERSE